jgi:hypothetical protein
MLRSITRCVSWVLQAVVDAAVKQAEQTITAPLQQTIQHLEAVLDEVACLPSFCVVASEAGRISA